jgi:hypothetical protein
MNAEVKSMWSFTSNATYLQETLIYSKVKLERKKFTVHCSA